MPKVQINSVEGSNNIIGDGNSVDYGDLNQNTPTSQPLATIYGIPSLHTIDLTKDQITWLKEIWQTLKETGSLQSYMELRAKTLNKTSRLFNPHLIDRSILKEGAVEITLLGVLHIDKDSKILDDIDRVALFIQGKLLNDPSLVDFNTNDLSDEIGLEKNYLRVAFSLAVNYGSFWNSASSAPLGKPFGYEQFTVGPNSFDFYVTYNGLRGCIDELFIRQQQWDVRYNSQPESIYPYKKTSPFWESNGKPISLFVNEERLKQLRKVQSVDLDLSKLVRLCEELNLSYENGCYYAVPALIRMIIDHVPPIFSKSNFAKVAAEHGNRNFKQAMEHLDKTSRKIADEILHAQISDKEVLPNQTRVNFSQDVDFLLGEIIRVLSRESS